MQMISERIHELCEEKSFPWRGRSHTLKRELKLDISYQAIQKWLDGESAPSREYEEAICGYFGVNYEWLAAGNGPKYKKETCGCYITDELEIKLIELIRDMPDYAKEQLIQDANQLKQIIERLKKGGGGGDIE
ncbi:helix-turn-helix transcriptional regulator [Nitrosomonas sp. Is37]|uniref:helix-turn-helix transcriptional regulator n=1 Tax=Nitrosomonas sp. Is37 TaxID=3080535 RepID=UPI00294B595A|nr:helix-turn-helix transcriptional regulator [Nitrosomonas sp. Is37]